MKKNTAAAKLGKLGAGKPKNYSEAELAKRRERLAAARGKRWAKPVILVCRDSGDTEIARQSCKDEAEATRLMIARNRHHQKSATPYARWGIETETR